MATRKRLLSLTWIGDDGEPYYEEKVSPRTARDVLQRNISAELWIDFKKYPFWCLTYAEVARARRVVKVIFPHGDRKGQVVLIDIAE